MKLVQETSFTTHKITERHLVHYHNNDGPKLGEYIGCSWPKGGGGGFRVGGLPYMTSEQKEGEGVKKYSKLAQTVYILQKRGGRGSKKSQNLVDVIYGRPLGCFGFMLG